MNERSDTELLQKRHFDSIAERCAQHYGDAWSQAWREYFTDSRHEPCAERRE